MTTQRPRYSKIERLVQSLLDDHGVVRPAVPIKSILVASGIEIREGNLGDVSGLIARLPENTIVGVNAHQHLTRRRFTMAHEFGHFLLHDGIAAHSDTTFRVNYRDEQSATATNVEEIEANFFAANILMPKHFLAEWNAADALDDDESVKRLAKAFNVSRHAMSLRLANVYGRHLPF